MPVTKRKKNKKRRFKKITLKLTSNQFKYLQKYCIIYRTTPNKLIKTLLSNHINSFPELKKQEEYHISKNQLKLFDMVNEAEGGMNRSKSKKTANSS